MVGVMNETLDSFEQEPLVKVGLMTGIARVRFTLNGARQFQFGLASPVNLNPGDYDAAADDAGGIVITAENGQTYRGLGEATFWDAGSTFIIRDVTIGVDFHWQRQEDQQFQGVLILRPDQKDALSVINEVQVEAYLTSVIASEMSATAAPELLKAHAIISRSWLLAQLRPSRAQSAAPPRSAQADEAELLRWYDRENHADFDICADDHCQRYQGLAKVLSPEVVQAVAATRGLVLGYDGKLCDARFSKSCGGFTELFSTAWEDADPPYLQAFYDGETFPDGYALPLSAEANAETWIRRTPPANCFTQDGGLLARILPNFDQATTDFYRWQVTLPQAELQALLQRKLGLEFGAVQRLEPVERGASGRLKRLRIVGENRTLIIGKELEIRRALSASHLYSSAFVVETGPEQAGAPAFFTLRGAGWGHGVGLCQIGAALLAERGAAYEQILRHYYRGARLFRLYS
jgi:stage II sporulation protein D